MSCIDPRRWQPKIALELGGELPPDERAAVAAHLDTCPACRDLARELTADRLALAALASEEPGPDALDRVRRAVLATVREEDGRRASAGWPGARSIRPALPALAAALCLLALGLVVWLPHPAPRPAPRLAKLPLAAGPEDAGPAPGGETSISTPAQAPPTGPGAASPAAEAAEAAQTTEEPAPAPSDRLAAAGLIADRAPDRLEPFPLQPSEPLGAAPAATEPAITIQIVSEDPDIVFYWLTDEPKEETNAEAV